MMSDLLRNDPKVLRGCILYEVLRGTPVFDAYKHFCGAVGNDAMEYREFEYWFYQYANGNSDLTCNKNPDQMKHLSFSDLPLGTVEDILGRLDWEQRLTLRKVSHSFRDLADKINPNFTYAYVRISAPSRKSCNSIRLEIGWNRFKRNRIVYTEVDGGCDVKYGWGFRSKRIEGEDFVEMALNDMKNFFICPKLQLETFQVSVERKETFDEVSEKIIKRSLSLMKENFKTLNHKIHVKNFHANLISDEEIMSILPFMKAGALEQININNYQRTRDPEIKMVSNKIVEMDQWKEAKILEITGLIIKDASIENFLHFSRFEVDLVSISIDDIIKLKNIALLSKNPLFYYKVNSHQNINIDAVEQQFLGYKRIETDQFNIIEFPIPNSDRRVLQLLLNSRYVTFR